jgi:hypothetical protein
MKKLILIIILLSSCVGPKKAVKKCSNWARKYPSYFREDTTITITTPEKRGTKNFTLTDGTTVVKYNNTQIKYNVDTLPPECDTIRINSVYRTEPDTIYKEIPRIVYKDKKNFLKVFSESINLRWVLVMGGAFLFLVVLYKILKIIK